MYTNSRKNPKKNVKKINVFKRRNQLKRIFTQKMKVKKEKKNGEINQKSVNGFFFIDFCVCANVFIVHVSV